MFFPSRYPRSRRPSRKASMSVKLAERVPENRTPIRGIFFGCCAWTGKQSAKSKVLTVSPAIFMFIVFSLLPSTRHSTLVPRPFSSDHSIRPLQHCLGNVYADLLGGVEIDHQLKLCRLLHWQISRLGAFQYFVQ